MLCCSSEKPNDFGQVTGLLLRLRFGQQQRKSGRYEKYFDMSAKIIGSVATSDAKPATTIDVVAGM
jgi:hypothetical protein